MRSAREVFFKTMAVVTAVITTIQFAVPSWAQNTASIPILAPMTLTAFYQPASLKGITIDPINPFAFDFLVDSGDDPRDTDFLKTVSTDLIKYFLASLTIPEEHMWVNLSPYEPDRIIPSDFGQTQMGQDLLALDYLLKQLSSSLMNPDDETGKAFWERVYQQAMEQYGTTDIPMNTFNKIWIVPSQASVSVKGQTVFINAAHLKVMLEEDYVALQKTLGVEHFGLEGRTDDNKFAVSGVTSEVVRNILIPAVEQEVNQGRTFAKLRQIYRSMILASWYKQNLKDSFLNKMVADSGMTGGVEAMDPKQHEVIYQQYVDAFRSGAFDVIREDYDPQTQQLIPRKYFSGGLDMHMNVATGSATEDDASLNVDQLFRVEADVIDKAMMPIDPDEFDRIYNNSDESGDEYKPKGVFDDDSAFGHSLLDQIGEKQNNDSTQLGKVRKGLDAHLSQNFSTRQYDVNVNNKQGEIDAHYYGTGEKNENNFFGSIKTFLDSGKDKKFGVDLGVAGTDKNDNLGDERFSVRLFDKLFGKKDKAMLETGPQALGANENTGGINLNSRMLQLDAGGEARQIVVPVGDPAMLKSRMTGFSPVIKSIQPFSSLPAAAQGN